MTMRRMFMMAGGAVIPVAVLALLFDNQWVVDAIRESDFKYDEGLGPLVSWSQALAWRFTPSTGSKWSFVLAVDFTLVLFFVLLALLVMAGARIIDPNRGPLGALIVGWWAGILASGISGLVFGPLLYWTLDLPSMSQAVFSSISQGVAAGFAFGWISGLGALGAFVATRPRTAGPQPYGAPQPYSAQQPYGAQQPYASQQYPQQQPYAPQHPGMQMQQPMQPHPSAVPYVPPQGQPQQQQQPQWGTPPVPQQQPGAPAPQQFSAPPVPPRQPEPETAADDAEPPEPKAAQEPPQDQPEDDDLDLADRTIVDRGRDEK